MHVVNEACVYCFQIVCGHEVCTTELGQVCAEKIDRWNDVSLYFATHRHTASTEVRTQSKFDVHIFKDRLSRPRVAVLKYLLNICNFVLPLCFRADPLAQCFYRVVDCRQRLGLRVVRKAGGTVLKKVLIFGNFR